MAFQIKQLRDGLSWQFSDGKEKEKVTKNRKPNLKLKLGTSFLLLKAN